jgi:hypothetical protein
MFIQIGPCWLLCRRFRGYDVMAGFLPMNAAQARTAAGGTRNDQMTDMTAIQRIKELDHERATLFEQAKEEALRRANQAVEDLNALGLKYRLVEGAAPAEVRAPIGGRKKTG